MGRASQLVGLAIAAALVAFSTVWEVHWQLLLSMPLRGRCPHEAPPAGGGGGGGELGSYFAVAAAPWWGASIRFHHGTGTTIGRSG